MSRRAISDYDRMKGYLARCDAVGLRQVRELLEFAMMKEGMEPAKPPRAARKKKDDKQASLPIGGSGERQES